MKRYIDIIMEKTKPRRLLYMAIDGVAPRAKFNQQRSRRFRSAKEVTDKKRSMEKAIFNLKTSNVKIENEESYFEDPWDLNQISPGTEFMTKLTKALREYIEE